MAFLRNLKPVPRAIVIGALTTAVIYAGSLITEHLPKKVVVSVPIETVPVESTLPTTPPPNAATPPVTPPEQPSGLTAAGSSDAGIDNVLKAGKK